MAARYTRESLVDAAARSESLSEAMTLLGSDPRNPGQRAYLGGRFRKLGVDIGHFQNERVRWTRGVLAEAVAVSANMNDVLRHLGVDRVGGWHTHLSRRIRKLGIDTSHFTGGTARPARDERSGARGPLRLIDSEHPHRVPGSRLKRALLDLGVKERCAHCGMGTTWQDKPLSLEVDHISGDWRDNRPHNLRLLCPNCHSATDTYRRKKRQGCR